nr:metallophosphoesterase [Sunxiuqinia sp.]
MNKMKSIYHKVGVVLFLLSIQLISAGQNENPLKFNNKGKFKIAQFTDIHWQNAQKAECKKTADMISHVLQTEQPDMVVLTGDVVNDPAAEGWKAVMALFEESKVPFAVVLGNHDDEAEWSRDQIFDYLLTLSGFVGEKGPKEVSGVGNYIIHLQAADSEETTALLYCFDSNAYCSNKEISDYDWIKFDQVAWYRANSNELTTMNGGSPVPALAFFHIPLPEYGEAIGDPTTAGIAEEEVCSPKINTGLFASFVEKKDVIGVFVGHDHNNNYVGIHKEIALAYGQSSGYSSYGDIGKGARIIELKEGEFGFDTWIQTLNGKSFSYNYPFGYASDFSKDEYLSAIHPKSFKNGINFNYFEGQFESVCDLRQEQPKRSGISQNISLKEAEADDYFGFEFEGLIQVPETGVYQFYSYSDDGSQLFIGDQLVVDNDGSHSAKRAIGAIALEKGFHPIKVLYFESYMGNTLEDVSYKNLTLPT